MVFFYRIRGGPCKGELRHLTLRPEDVICYVGRNKHENEDLIAHGWPGDVWFHVDGVSSAHVYFRLNYDVAAARGIAPQAEPSDSTFSRLFDSARQSCAEASFPSFGKLAFFYWRRWMRGGRK